MEIHLEKRAVKLIRSSAQDAIEEGDTEALREDIMEAFSEEQVEDIERRLDSGDFFEFLTDLLDEWSMDDVDELFELIETQMGELGVDLKYDAKGIASVDDDEEDEDDDFDDEDEDEDDDDDDVEEEAPVDEDLLSPPKGRSTTSRQLAARSSSFVGPNPSTRPLAHFRRVVEVSRTLPKKSRRKKPAPPAA